VNGYKGKKINANSRRIISERLKDPDRIRLLQEINLIQSEHIQMVIDGFFDANDYLRSLKILGELLIKRMGEYDENDLSRYGLSVSDDISQRIYGYPRNFLPQPPFFQLQLLETHDFCKNLRSDEEYIASFDKKELPYGSEFWSVIPKPSAVAGSNEFSAENYLKALWAVLDCIDKQRKFKNWRKGLLGIKHVQLLEKTFEALRFYEQNTPKNCDYMVIPVQFGKLHQGKSVSDVYDSLAENEFGLGIYEVAILLLIHPRRINRFDHLGIDCPGCEYRLSENDEYTEYFSFGWDRNINMLFLGYFNKILPFSGFGSATGFIAR